MAKNTNHINMVFFLLELMVAIFIPFIIWWSHTPTNILNSNYLFKLLELVGLGGSTLIFFAGIPVGIIGIWKAKRTGKLRIATTTLSLLNISAGMYEIAIVILIFYAVIFRGASV